MQLAHSSETAASLPLAWAARLIERMQVLYGAKFAQQASPVYLRLALATIVLVIALRMAWGLGVRPDDIYTVAPL